MMDNKVNPKTLEELLEYKKILDTKSDSDRLSQILNRLHEIEVSYELLSTTKIGKSLTKLTKFNDYEIVKLSEQLIEKWKKLVKSSKEKETTLEKKDSMALSKKSSTNSVSKETNTASNKLTLKLEINFNDSNHPGYRNTIKKLMFDAIVNGEDNSIIISNMKEFVLETERLMYESLYRLDDKGSKYFNRGKAIASNLRDSKNVEFKARIKNGEVSAKDLVTMDVKDMASTEMQSKRKQVEKESFNSIRSDWHDVYTPVSEGLHVCENCSGKRTTSKEIQMRGADEPMTLFIRCADCGNEWKIG